MCVKRLISLYQVIVQDLLIIGVYYGSYNIFVMSQTNPRAQVPGYCGYIPGKNSENKFGSTFGHLTKDAYSTQQQAFLTTNISSNSFIQQQYTKDHQFWGNDGKVSAFQQSSKEPKKNNVRIDAPKFQPQPATKLTYEQAVRKAHR